jgi:argininosuccinate lyase
LFTVDTLNEMVVAGMPFRDAYKAVAEQLENGTFNPQKKPNTHMKAVSTIYVWTR